MKSGAYQKRLRKTEGSHTPEEWRDLLLAWDVRCVYCHRQLDEDVRTKQHVLPIALGGCDHIGNIVPACRTCNERIGAKIKLPPCQPDFAGCRICNSLKERINYGDHGAIRSADENR